MTYPTHPQHPEPGWGPAGQYAQSQYPQSQYAPFQRPQPYPPHPPRKGPLPTVLNVLGGLFLLVGVGLLIVGAVLFFRTLPTDVLSTDGSPGAGAVASAQPGDQISAELEADSQYTLFVAQPSLDSGSVSFDGSPQITAPSGADVGVRPSPFNASMSAGGMEADAAHSFQAAETGVHSISVPALQDPTVEGEVAMILVEDGGFGGFLGTLFGAVGSVFGGILLCLTGGVLLIIGIAVGLSRRSRRRRYYGHP